LHYACYFGNRRVIDLLLDYNANINIQDNDGNTPLHYAVNCGCQRSIKKLLIRGAKKKIPNHEGRTPYSLAIDSNQYDVSKLIESKSLIRKYLCMESEITEFKPSRNDLVLLGILFGIITFKITYLIRLYVIIDDQPIDEMMSCIGI
jgi:ankyrin repeat protein